jgi:UDP-N-acetylmuramoyl-L-alanyl-D-glutamate--2,6-diaminopimelate ligase
VPHREVIGTRLDQRIESASSDSRIVFPKSIFLAQQGAHFHGLDFFPSLKDKVVCCIAPCKEKERVAALSRRFPQKVFVLTNDLKPAKRSLADILFKDVSGLDIIGITGTNGKTTVSFLIDKILKDCQGSSALLGTVSYAWKDKKFPSFLTTLDNFMLRALLQRIKEDKVRYVVLEASSHGLVQGRLEGLRLKRAVFTNLSHDHLDFHKTFSAYFKAKLKVFDYLARGGKALINADDRYGQIALRRLKKRALSFGLKAEARYKAKAFRFDKRRLEFLINLRGKNRIVRAPLLGTFNISNTLAALACCDSLGLDPDRVIASILRFKAPPGRLEQVSQGIFIDYAHTPDALSQALSALREAGFKKIILVFGCGGDRDALKRPRMGRVASSKADQCIVTSDNPRSEDPARICKDITKGMKGHTYQVIFDRRKAIKKALGLKRGSATAVLIAGKGHEDYQIFKDRTIKFSDKQTVKELLK